MSSVQVSFDNLHSDPRTVQRYEPSSTHGYPQYPSSHHDTYLERFSWSAQSDALQHFYPDAAHLTEQYDAFSGHYHMSAMDSAFFEPHFCHDEHARSPHHVPWICQDSNDGPGVQPYNPIPNSVVMHIIDSAIDSSHTTLTRRANLAAQAAQYQPVAGSSQDAFSGELDPETGQFRRAVPHNRQRTVQACEPCRKRKAKVRLIRVGSLLRLMPWLHSAAAAPYAEGVSARVSSACTLQSGRCAAPTSTSARAATLRRLRTTFPCPLLDVTAAVRCPPQSARPRTAQPLTIRPTARLPRSSSTFLIIRPYIVAPPLRLSASLPAHLLVVVARRPSARSNSRPSRSPPYRALPSKPHPSARGSARDLLRSTSLARATTSHKCSHSTLGARTRRSSPQRRLDVTPGRLPCHRTCSSPTPASRSPSPRRTRGTCAHPLYDVTPY